MRQQPAILISSIVLLSFCTSCDSPSPEATANAQVGDSDAADIVAQSAQPPTAPQDFSPAATSGQSSSQSSSYSATQSDRSTNTGVYRENFTCETATYKIEILGDTSQPSMVVRLWDDGIVLNSPADVVREKDDSLVFTNLRGESTYYVTVYPNTNTCNLQIVSTSGSVTVNESGRLVPRGGSDDTDTDLDAYRLGYQQGFKAGYESGFNYRKYKYGYYPDSAYRRPSYGDEGYLQGYRDGFFAGFHQGYYSVVEGMW